MIATAPAPPTHLEAGSTAVYACFPSARLRIVKSAGLREHPLSLHNLMRTIVRLRPETAW